MLLILLQYCCFDAAMLLRLHLVLPDDHANDDEPCNVYAKHSGDAKAAAAGTTCRANMGTHTQMQQHANGDKAQALRSISGGKRTESRTHAGATAVAAGLPGLTRLARLDLDNNGIGGAGGLAVAREAARLPALATLYLRYNESHIAMSEEDTAKVLRARLQL